MLHKTNPKWPLVEKTILLHCYKTSWIGQKKGGGQKQCSRLRTNGVIFGSYNNFCLKCYIVYFVLPRHIILNNLGQKNEFKLKNAPIAVNALIKNVSHFHSLLLAVKKKKKSQEEEFHAWECRTIRRNIWLWCCFLEV